METSRRSQIESYIVERAGSLTAQSISGDVCSDLVRGHRLTSIVEGAGPTTAPSM